MKARNLKILSSFILLAAAAAFAAEGQGADILDNFKTISRYDSYGWALLLTLFAMLQIILLRCSHWCLKCRAWGDFLLQLSGLALLIIGSAFVAAYPPFSWFMAVFPIVGLLFVFAGRVFGNKTRAKLKGGLNE